MSNIEDIISWPRYDMVEQKGDNSCGDRDMTAFVSNLSIYPSPSILCLI